jgi:hypothetical protein
MDLPEGPAIAWLRERAKGGPIVLPLPRVVAHTSGASSEQAKERDREQEIDDDEAEDSQDAYEGVS